MGRIPPERDAAFVCQPERVPEVCRRPDDPKRPVVCMGEPPEPLISEARRPLPPAPGRPARVGYEYVREGTRAVWMFLEPLGGWRDVRVTGTKTAVDRAHRVRRRVDDPRYARAERITLACDDPVTDDLTSLGKAFEPAEALRIARRLELAHSPRHGSWLNVAESELAALSRQGLDRPIAVPGEVEAEAGAWSGDRDARQVGVEWPFTAEDARVKLKHL